MKIEIHHIPEQGTTLRLDREAKHFANLKALAAKEAYIFKTPIDITLTVVPAKDLYRVKGRIAVHLELACARCLNAFEAPIDQRFTLNYSRKIVDDLHDPDSTGEELTAQQIGMYYFEGEEIDFTDAIQEQVVMAIPYRALCADSCKGLCVRCGADLNKTTCQCETSTKDNPFSVLKDLKLS